MGWRDYVPRVPREEKPFSFEDIVAYDAERTMSSLQVGLRVLRVQTQRVEVRSSATHAKAVELLFNMPLPRGRHAQGTITVTPENGQTHVKVSGTSDMPFANAAVNALMTRAIDMGNERIQRAAHMRASRPDAPEAPRGPEGPTTPGQ